MGADTQHITAYFVTPEICKRIGVEKACIIDVPGTGDCGSETSLPKLIAKIEVSLTATPVHTIVLVNKATDDRVHSAVKIATILLEKNFIKAADQIIGVMTKCDLVRKITRERNRDMWKNALKEAFGKQSNIPVVMCAVPVNERTYDVIEIDEYEEMYDTKWGDTPTIEPTIRELARLAKNPRVAKFVQADGGKVIAAIGEVCGIPVKNMQKQIKTLEQERDAKEKKVLPISNKSLSDTGEDI
eukprot:TRINITY_DN395_c0_g1_i3.p1 TRINITY_DN395_c0_g1~~TRINITY_DN395_c0_g1_i3.p1  ORF type:complete len:243 (+),score=32.28 TRINITY_DN395_c0_g1_i3:45-773(+)